MVYHADGVLCPVTLAMHLAAAVPVKPGVLGRRPCVVVAGGREPPHWEAYPHHQYIHTVGSLACCAEGGCWRSRCQTVGDGDAKDRYQLCQQPVEVREDLRIPRCMAMITPDDVVRRIEWYLERTIPQNAARENECETSHHVESSPSRFLAGERNPEVTTRKTRGPPRAALVAGMPVARVARVRVERKATGNAVVGRHCYAIRPTVKQQRHCRRLPDRLFSLRREEPKAASSKWPCTSSWALIPAMSTGRASSLALPPGKARTRGARQADRR